MNFYLTTPIYYVNDEHHIGHAYTTILADVIARYHRMMGKNVFLLTGTDEHGQKVQQAAKKRGVDPTAHVNEFVQRYMRTWEKLNINYSDFIRTTEKRHTDRVKDLPPCYLRLYTLSLHLSDLQVSQWSPLELPLMIPTGLGSRLDLLTGAPPS